MSEIFCCSGDIPSRGKITVWMPLACRVLIKSDEGVKIFYECNLQKTTRLIWTNDCDKIYTGTYRLTYYFDGEFHHQYVGNFGSERGEIIGTQNNVRLPGGFIGAYIIYKRCNGTIFNHFQSNFQTSNDAAYMNRFTTTIEILSIDNPDEISTCELTLKKEDNIIHQQIYDECPQVYEEPCKPNGSKQIFYVDLNIIPFTQTDPLPPISPMPSMNPLDYTKIGFYQECLEFITEDNQLIVNKITYKVVPGKEKKKIKTDLLVTYNSPDGCEAPLYEVECNPTDKEDDCKKCPPGTFELICDNNVCCYNEQNCQLVYSFNLSERC